MFKVDSVVEKWLEENEEKILANISDTIERWLERHKDEIYDIIRDKNGGVA